MTDPIAPRAFKRLDEMMAEPDRPMPAPNSTLGKYRLHHEVARGAMGVVFEAEDLELSRPVAVKILHQVLEGNDAVRARFDREARSAAKLSHPNVVRVYDAGEAGGRAFLVMELVAGRPLSEILGGRNYEIGTMLRLLEKAARGVAAAHEAGIVHRDVKPANILVGEGNEPKVGDFGLAHWMDSEAALTKTGTPLGTPLYMAPEQVRGGASDVTPATDVYALGAILYEILTGRPPHVGENVAEIYSKIVGQEPMAPRRLNPRADREAETICLKAIEPDPRRRYPTAKEFADDLKRHLDGESILAQPPGAVSLGVKWARRHRAAAGMLAVGLAGVVAVGVVFAAKAADRRREIEGALAAGSRRLSQFANERARLEAMKEEERQLRETIPPHEGDEIKKPLWDLQGRIEAQRRTVVVAEVDAVAALSSVLELDPGNAAARIALAAHYLDSYERAEEAGDRLAMAAARKQIERHDDGRVDAALRRPGTLVLDSQPTGATVELSLVEEGPDGRRIEMATRSLGTCPLAGAALPAGDYLAVLRRDGFRDVRLPLRIERGRERRATVTLYTEAQIGAGFRYVPAGPFIMGGDPEAKDSGERKILELGNYFIGTHEVTNGEYAEFLADVIEKEGVQAATTRMPRKDGKGMVALERGSNRIVLSEKERRLPVAHVSWENAEEYCLWRSRVEGATLRLPTGAEWEKAARGVDGRSFPWGDRFDYSFTNGGESDPLVAQPRAVGSCPKDESPYGVRDLGGNLQEFGQEWRDDRKVWKCIHGGAFPQTSIMFFRSSSRIGVGATSTSVSIGFRVVKEAPR